MDKKNIESIYALAPLQQAFLWHSLQTSVKTGLLHIRCTLRSKPDTALDIETLRQAWNLVVSRHPALRTSVHWESVRQPVQVVARQIALPWIVLDWRKVEAVTAKIEDFLKEDRDRSFDLTQAPIMRLALIRTSDTDYELVWSCHHLMLDGWSGALVLNQVADSYEALKQDKPLSTISAQPYQAYIRWLKQQNEEEMIAFWRKTLSGFAAPTPLPVSSRENSPISEQAVSVTLTAETTESLQYCLRSHYLTLSTFVQGLWALLLHRYSGQSDNQSDILFGTTVSGRQADLAGVETIVGLLINVVPVRVKVSLTQSIMPWLQTLQAQQSAASRYAHASLAQIQSASELPSQPFDTLLVIENYPVTAPESSRSLQVNNIRSGIVSTYGLTAVVKPAARSGEGLTLTIHTATRRFEHHQLKQIISDFETTVEKIIETIDGTLSEILPVTTPIRLPKEKASASVEQSSQSTEIQPFPSADLSRETLASSFVAPQTSLELKLAKIWSSVLQVRPLSVNASFFDLGGSSLQAVQIFNQMQAKVSCTLPLASLFQAPTVRAFATLLGSTQETNGQTTDSQTNEHSNKSHAPLSKWFSLVPIQPQGTQLPLFFHGGSADALTWARFSYLLGKEQPFYALQRPDLDGSAIAHNTVESLATACLREIQAVQPQGPYLLGGHCFGGAVAFEIAQQLQAKGETIASLLLIDAYRPEKLPETALTQFRTQLQLGRFWLKKNYYYHGGWHNLAKLPHKVWQRLRPQSSPVTASPVEAVQTIASPVEAIQTAEVSASSAVEPKPYEYRYAQAQIANEIASEHYIAQAYSGQVQLFRARAQSLDWYFGPELGWQTVVKEGVSVTTIPGFFGNLFNQRSGPVLAEQVRSYLTKLNSELNSDD